jgi:uncharacterized protein YraI
VPTIILKMHANSLDLITAAAAAAAAVVVVVVVVAMVVAAEAMVVVDVRVGGGTAGPFPAVKPAEE